jgi:hypothetical protein
VIKDFVGDKDLRNQGVSFEQMPEVGDALASKASERTRWARVNRRLVKKGGSQTPIVVEDVIA